MQTDNKDAILLKNLILSRYNFLSDVAKKLKIDLSTLSRKIKKPSRVFLEELKSIDVPIPDEMLNPSIERIRVKISTDGVTGFFVKEPTAPYDEISIVDLQNKYKIALEEIVRLKSEIYDLKKQIKELENANNS